MRTNIVTLCAALGLGLLTQPLSAATVTYWNVFNIEGESSIAADIVTYATLTDMLADTNRTGVSTMGGFGRNIVGSGSDGRSYWNVFNIEGESSIAADIVTYATLTDMLADTNRTGVSTMGGFGRNIVGSGSDGRAYWNVFNIEGESSIAADIVTYATLTDMLADSNRTGVSTMGGFGRNIVGSGSDGRAYWNVFNIEGESSIAADIVTYATLTDMLADTNRTGVSTMGGFGRNIVGSGSDGFVAVVPAIPLPAPAALLGGGIAALALLRRRRPDRRSAGRLSGVSCVSSGAPGRG